ncbi:MAG: hypothetical protein AB8B83_04440 [Bdellovibrionales bacterium]
MTQPKTDELFKLDHDNFTLEIIEGKVTKTHLLHEIQNIDPNNALPAEEQKQQTKNKRALWLTTTSGDDYYFIVNARIPLEEGQTIKILASIGTKTQALIIYDNEEKQRFTNASIISLAFYEAQMLNTFLFIGAAIGIFFAMGPAIISALYTGLILFIAMRWFTRLGFYKKKIDTIKEKHFKIEDND